MTEQKDEFDKMEKCLKAVKTWNDYKGDLSMELFTEILDSRLEFYKISEPANKLIVLKNTVVGSECGKILKLKDNLSLDYEATKKLLVQCMDGKSEKPWNILLAELGKMELTDFDDLPQYFRKFCAIAVELGDEVTDLIKVQYFIKGLPDNIQDYCNTQSCKTLTEVFKKASELYRGPQNTRAERNGCDRNGNTPRNGLKDRRYQNGDILCYFCNYTGHTQRNCQYYLKAQQEAQKHEKINRVRIKEDSKMAEPDAKGTCEYDDGDDHVEGNDGAEEWFGDMYDN